MIPNITRGARMRGVLAYLVGPGRENEHREPHLVAGDSSVMAWHDDAELDHAAAMEIAATLDHPRRAFGTRVTVAAKDADGQPARRARRARVALLAEPAAGGGRARRTSGGRASRRSSWS